MDRASPQSRAKRSRAVLPFGATAASPGPFSPGTVREARSTLNFLGDAAVCRRGLPGSRGDLKSLTALSSETKKQSL